MDITTTTPTSLTRSSSGSPGAWVSGQQGLSGLAVETAGGAVDSNTHRVHGFVVSTDQRNTQIHYPRLVGLSCLDCCHFWHRSQVSSSSFVLLHIRCLSVSRSSSSRVGVNILYYTAPGVLGWGTPVTEYIIFTVYCQGVLDGTPRVSGQQGLSGLAVETAGSAVDSNTHRVHGFCVVDHQADPKVRIVSLRLVCNSLQGSVGLR
ncbi:hypothetical protein Tco_1173554 [Tanacetum coccineum]